jgi:hypothetical protein
MNPTLINLKPNPSDAALYLGCNRAAIRYHYRKNGDLAKLLQPLFETQPRPIDS